MAYPADIYTQRDLENLPGLTYDPLQKKTLFAEDILKIGGEVHNIENTLGINPQGEYDTVAERLDNSSGGGGPIEQVTLATAAATFEFAALTSLDTMKFAKVGIIIPGTLSNAHFIVEINGDTTGSNYKKNTLDTGYSTAAVTTSDTISLVQLGVAADDTSLVDIEFFKTAGKYLNYLVKLSYFSSFGDPQQGFRHVRYAGTTADITSIVFRRNSGNWPVGTTFILRGF